MRLLNVGCGGQRPQGECWWNTDNLRTQLKEGTPERINLDREPRYVECDLLTQSLPFPSDHFDGVLLQHVIEHFTCHESVDVLMKCRRVMKPGGIMLVSVPDAQYFLDVYEDDTKENALGLFGEPIHDEGHDKFFTYALFRHDHKQVLTTDSLLCLLIRAGLKSPEDRNDQTDQFILEMETQLTRRKFSLEILAVK